MPKRRLGVALLVPPPFDREVDALRRACSDGAFGRIPSHLTLVPPVNVREDAVQVGLRVLREAAAATRPFTVQLGPPASFLPDSPTLYLSVNGPGLAALHALRDAIFRDPLARPLTWPFVPHVTVAHEMEPSRIEAALGALAGYRAVVTFERVHLLQEGNGRVWTPIADAVFAAPAVVGRGGIELELATSDAIDAETGSFAAREWALWDQELYGAEWDERPFAITARSVGDVAGMATGWTNAGLAYLVNLLVGAPHRGLGVGSRLLAAFESLAAERDCRRLALRTIVGTPALEFYLRRGWAEEARFTDWYFGREIVQLRRDL
jgi:2'-5' RNA ligase/ribosomal protein S18 acetylase RimI-like enzyme